MFGKVVKHELRADGLLYGVCFVIAVLFCITTVINGRMIVHASMVADWMTSTWVFLVMACGISVAVLVLMYGINTAIRYDHSMYGREGYLTFTLPISTTKLVLGKMASAMIWGTGVFVVCGLLCFSILYSTINPEVGIMSTWELVKSIFSEQEIVLNIVLFLLFCLLGILELISMIYISVCIAYLPCFRKGNRIIALVLFFVISFVEDKILGLVSFATQHALGLTVETDIMYIPNGIELAQRLFSNFRILCIMGIVLCVIFTTIYTSITIYLTKKYTTLQ